jgi:hypothetical protein
MLVYFYAHVRAWCWLLINGRVWLSASRTKDRILKMVSLLIDPNTVPRQIADRTGDLVFNVLWSYVEKI